MLRQNKQTASEKQDFSAPPEPTRFTLFIRRCIVVQIFRFFVLNLKIMRIVVGGHK